MLNKLDDYPIHQTPEPIAHLANSDINAYDRTWFNGYANDGSYYFGAGMAIYPHRNIMDGAFSIVSKDKKQHCFFGSRRAPDERTDMTVGPLRIEIIEPMRKSRLLLEDNASGLSCDLTFSALSAGIEETRQTLKRGTRSVMDATRFAQFGYWQGEIDTPEGSIKIERALCRATKDRSWGMRNVGEPKIGGAPERPGSIFFFWAPLFWDDHVSHAIFFDDTQGEVLVREALCAPLYADTQALPAAASSPVARMATAVHRIDYHLGTRLAKYAELDLINPAGDIRTISLKPVLKFQMKGLGYNHPIWNHGNWQGELATGFESFDPEAIDLLALEHLHVQQVVIAHDGHKTGIGVMEQLVIGPYAPAGFVGLNDGYK